MTFREYYEFYLTLHQNKWCRRMHFLGQFVTILLTFFVLYGWHWYLIPFIPFVVYPFAWAGHFFFEENSPAAFTRPIWAKACDWVMLREMLTGRIKF